MFLKRNAQYRKLEKLRSLFDDIDNQLEDKPTIYEIRERVKLKFDDLEFHYGCILFNYVDKKTGELTEFSIGNDTIRPEFTILKSYFARQLKIKSIEVDIYAEFKDDKLIAQEATSPDISKINSEIIDSAINNQKDNKTTGELHLNSLENKPF